MPSSDFLTSVSCSLPFLTCRSAMVTPPCAHCGRAFSFAATSGMVGPAYWFAEDAPPTRLYAFTPYVSMAVSSHASKPPGSASATHLYTTDSFPETSFSTRAKWLGSSSLRNGNGRGSGVRPFSSWMSYTMNPSVASVALRSTNLRAVSRISSSFAPSRGGVRPAVGWREGFEFGVAGSAAEPRRVLVVPGRPPRERDFRSDRDHAPNRNTGLE